MEKVKVRLNKRINRTYGILIDKNLFGKIPEILKKKKLGNKYLIITDNNVEKLFGKKLLAAMKKQKLDVNLISFKAGEQSKNLRVLEELLTKTQKLGLDRKSVIVALGGGVVGDVAGFVAATYMRGINYVQIPTSLLAMVDSSIGGKVAVDLLTGKNMVGAFHQPKSVFIDVSLLKNLPKKELLCGLSEVIKHALIMDKKLFDFIDDNIDKILAKELDILIKLIRRNCEIKAKIVEKDENEEGLRKLVNYGHTVGHAIETLTHYKKFSHGEAIAIGMAVAGRISNKLDRLSVKELEMQNDMLKRVGLSIKMPDLDKNVLIEELRKDKKASDGKIEFVLLDSIGKARYGILVPNKIIVESLR